MKKILLLLLAVVSGLAVAVYRIADYENSNAFFHNGNWVGSNNLPLGEDDLLTAQVSVFALFALPGSEAVYLFAKRDNRNERLHAEKDYEIKGNIHQIHALYWSITLYGKDLFLIPNEAERYSFNNTNIETDSAGNFSILISASRQTGNWLPAPPNARFGLVLRIYKGEKTYLDGLNTTLLPVIKAIEK